MPFLVTLGYIMYRGSMHTMRLTFSAINIFHQKCESDVCLGTHQDFCVEGSYFVQTAGSQSTRQRHDSDGDSDGDSDSDLDAVRSARGTKRPRRDSDSDDDDGESCTGCLALACNIEGTT